MPIYEFACQDCGHGFEELLFSRSDHVLCPSCDSGSVARQMSAFAIRGTRADGSKASSGGCSGACSGGNCAGCSGNCNCH